MGSPCLKESRETHLSDVLNDSTEVSVVKDRSTSEKILVQIPTDVEDRAQGRDTNTSISGVPVLTPEKGTPSMTSLPRADVLVPPEGSQDSILDIEGFGDEEDEVSLMDWSAQQDGKVPPSFQAAWAGDAQKDAPDNKDTWRSLVHPDDPFLSLIPCEIPRLASVLQQCHYIRGSLNLSNGFSTI